MKDKTIKISPEDYFKVKEYSQIKFIPIREIIRRAVRKYFADKN